MTSPSSWRELLGQIIQNAKERGRIANEMGIRTITLNRWVNGETVPRTYNIRQLHHAIPVQYRPLFLELLEKEHITLSDADLPNSVSSEIDGIDGIDAHFIMQVLATRASTDASLLSWAISHLVLQHALRLLDPDRTGMAITIVQCMLPSQDGFIRSLRETVGLGTTPWQGELAPKNLFLGASSLAGHVVTNGRAQIINNITLETYIPALQIPYEVSAMASPIMYANRVAGCLLLSSTQPNYFSLETRQALVQDYTHLIAQAFEPGEFYDLKRINLQVMPSPEVQIRAFASFRQRVQALMKAAQPTAQLLTLAQAEAQVRQQIEQELLQYFREGQE